MQNFEHANLYYKIKKIKIHTQMYEYGKIVNVNGLNKKYSLI